MPKRKKAPPKKPAKPKVERPEAKWTNAEAAEHLFPKPAVDAVRHTLDSVRPKFESSTEEE